MWGLLRSFKERTMQELESSIKAALLLAYEAGRWHGQVDLEIAMDKEQYSQALAEVFASMKTSLPNDLASTGRTVRYNLRSDEWREGVIKSCLEYFEKAEKMALEKIEILQPV